MSAVGAHLAAGRPAGVGCRTLLAFCALLLCTAGTVARAAAPIPTRWTVRSTTPVTLSASFSPMALGKRTTLEFGFHFEAPAGQVPEPLTAIELRYPSNLGLGLSGLGLATCDTATMQAAGPGGCPPNAVMGFGEVLTGVVLGTQIVSEAAPITIMRAPDEEGRLAVLFYAEGTQPIDARIIFPGLLLPSRGPFGGVVNIGVPLVETLPGAPYVSVIKLHSTIGPKKVVYYEQVDGHTLAYQPRGILLPRRCPAGGFPFAARFLFNNETSASAKTTIPCLHSRRH
ncbi:MAG TPA: hypothetical protein VFW38_03040 [Solirubrobacteraceae bacterium]|nr:hypothetical protein [Solirubrobacteraceae bacterium]